MANTAALRLARAAAICTLSAAFAAATAPDPYGWMENAGNAAFGEWLDRETAATRALFARMPQLARVEAVSKAGRPTGRPEYLTSAAGRLFFLAPASDGSTALFVRNADGAIAEVASGRRFETDRAASLGAFAVSPDGQTIAVHVYVGDAHDSDVHVLRTADGSDEEPPLHHTVYDAIGFTPDGASLIYSRASGDASSGNLIPGVVYQRLHRLRTPQDDDVVLLGPGVSDRIAVAAGAFAFVDTPDASRWAIAEVRDVAAGGSRFYVAPQALLGKPNVPWLPIGGPEDLFSDYSVRGDVIDLTSRRGAPNYCIVRVDLRHPAERRVVLPPSDRVVVSGTLDGIPKAGIFASFAAADADYVQLLDGGVSSMVRIPYAGNESPAYVALPLKGTILEAASDPRRRGIYLDVTSWTSRGDVYGYDARAERATALGLVSQGATPRTAAELDATASDGTPIPVSIVRNASTALDGAHPVMLTVVGSYGFSTTPDYDRVPQTWLDLGGVYAIAHVRGGGEGGDAWHRAAIGAGKARSWTDLIAAAEMLVGRRYASRQSLDLYSGLASYLGGIGSGIAAGRAVEERPDLFAAVVMDAPAPDMLRSETTPLGRESVSEFGSTSTRDGFAALEAMSPYEHVPAGATLPPLLVRSYERLGIGNDWQAAKFVARVRDASPSNVAYFESVGGGERRDSQTLANERFAFYLWANGRNRTR